MILRASLPPVLLCALVLSMKFSVLAQRAPNNNPPPLTEVPVYTLAFLHQSQSQVTNMVDALRNAGKFGAIAGLLEGLQMKSITPMTTWLAPNDAALFGSYYPRNLTKFLDYHVIQELLPFSKLVTLHKGTRMPTFLGSETAVVTNNERFHYMINNAMIIVPDLYRDATIAVHGINAVLDDASYNGIEFLPAPVPFSYPSEAPAPSYPGQQAPPNMNMTPMPSSSPSQAPAPLYQGQPASPNMNIAPMPSSHPSQAPAPSSHGQAASPDMNMTPLPSSYPSQAPAPSYQGQPASPHMNMSRMPSSYPSQTPAPSYQEQTASRNTNMTIDGDAAEKLIVNTGICIALASASILVAASIL